jgi:hypothetical protein
MLAPNNIDPVENMPGSNLLGQALSFRHGTYSKFLL